MSTVSFSANGREVKRAYDSIINGESTFEWALYGYEDDSNEIELVDSGSGLQQLCDEFDEDEYQYAFARVTDPNTNLPRFVFISWCGESVPFTKKGKYNTFTNDILKFFSGFHIHINARSKFDVEPDEIMKKVKSCSGANYSFHQNENLKNKFNNSKVEPKVEPKPQENQLQTFPSLPKRNPLNDNSNESPTENRGNRELLRRRSSCGYNPLEPNASKVEAKPQENELQTFHSLPKRNPLNDNINESPQENKLQTFPSLPNRNPLNDNCNESPTENKGNRELLRRRSSCGYNPLEPNASRRNSVVRDTSRPSFSRDVSHNGFVNLGEASEKEDETKVCPGNIRSKISAFQNQIVETNVNNEKVEEKKPEKSLSRRSSCSYNPLEPNASRRNSVSNDIGFEACTGNISSKISAFQNQIQKTDEENKKEQAIKKEISSRNLKNWNQRINNIKEEPEIRSNESIAVQPPESKSNATQGKTAKALYSYEATEEGELSFEEDDIITNIVDIPGDGWWSGNNSKGEYGMFPSNYVECNNDDGGEKVVVQEKAEKPAVDNGEKSISAKAIYSYEAQDDTEIDLEEGEIITGIILQDEDWAIGFNHKSKQGMFPLNYVELIQ